MLSIPPFEFPFKEFPRLETKRLILREITRDDAEPLFRIWSDVDWMKLWGLPIHKTIDDTRAMIDRLTQAYNDRAGLRWALTIKGNDEAIGTCGFSRFIPQHYRAEIAAEIARPVSSNGYTTEAFRTVLKFGFEVLDLHSIEADIDPGHEASIALVDTLGFKREGLLRENYFLDGKFYDTIIFSLLSGRPPFRPVPK